MKPVNNNIDVIFGEEKAAVEVNASLGLQYFFGGFFNNATEDVLVSASVGLVAAASSTAVGLELSTPVTKTGHGADVIIGVATATTTVSAIASVAVTALIEAINQSEISSTVSATAFALAIANATAVGIDGSGVISTGNGADLIVGEATANSIAEAMANASADVLTNSDGTSLIDSSVFTTLFSTTEVHATAIGIRGGEYDLGNGSDTIIARATGVGTNIGVQDVLINGGKGHDRFDLQSGTGEIIGGKGLDLLMLEGSISDYLFADLDLSLGVNIQNSHNNTNLFVSEVEAFQFAADSGLTYQYADLTLV